MGGVTGDYGDDATLVEALRDGDEAAFTWLLDHHGPGLRRVARRHVRTDASADEVVADTWLAVIRGIDGFEGRSSVRTWLYRVLLNIARTRGTREARQVPAGDLADDRDRDPDEEGTAFAVDRFRRHPPMRGHWQRPPSPWEEDPTARLAAREAMAVVAAAVDALPERQRAALVLRDVEGWSAAEVSGALEVSEGNQRVLLHRARARVRDALETAHDQGWRP